MTSPRIQDSGELKFNEDRRHSSEHAQRSSGMSMGTSSQ